MDTLQIEAFRLELSAQRLWQGKDEVQLTAKAFAVLRYLVEHRERLVSRDDLFEAVWGTPYVSEAALAACIRELRRALGDSAQQPTFIQTVRGRGYRFVAAVTPADPPAPLTPATALDPPPMETSGVPQPLAAERRQLTVLFCDLVDWTRLAEQLDPEDLREVLQAYHQTCAEVVERFDGYVAQYLGDGVLAYFGYPVAHEDDAQRAVWSGLGLLEALAALNARLALPWGYQLAIRLGVHTGLVVVGEVGTGARHEPLAQGETPPIAARLQSLAGANELVISAATRDLVGGVFQVKDLGVQTLRGITAPLQVYRVLGAQAVASRFEAMMGAGLTPLVGREEELGLLWRRWEQATEGEGQVVLLSGEAGLGKSRLTQTLSERLAEAFHLRLLYQCSPYHTNSAFYPLVTHLERAMQLEHMPQPAAKLDRLEVLLAQAGLPVAEVAPLLAALLALPHEDRYAPLLLSPERQKDRTMAAWAEWVVGLSQRSPVLGIVEDVHWSDPSTLEALTYVIDRVQAARVLLVLTFRPEFVPPWGHFAHVTTHTLNRLTRRQVATMVQRIATRQELPAELVAQIVTRTDGVPLFVEELTKTVLESAWLQEPGERDALAGSQLQRVLPVSLRDALMARLDRLQPAVKEVAQMGAVIGREFTYALLAAVSPLHDDTLREALDALVTAGLLFGRGTPPEVTYMFKHALVQDVAYASLLRSTRRDLHTTLAQVLEACFPQTVETQPELLAYHYTEAGLHSHAIPYWQRAGQRASERSAYQEAMHHLTTGLSLLQTLPETLARHQQELRLQAALGAAAVVVRGQSAPDVEAAYTRARVLCQQLGDTQDVFPVLYGLSRFYVGLPDLLLARQLGEELLSLAERKDETPLYVVAHYTLGSTCMWMGELLLARRHLEESIARDTPAQQRPPIFWAGLDPGVGCRAFAALTLWSLGSPDQALARAHEALALATELAHPFSYAFALTLASMVWQFRHEGQDVYEHAEATVTLSTEQGFPFWLAMSTFLRGWALTVQWQQAEGLTQMRQGFTDYRASGAELGAPYFLTLLAEGYGTLEQVEAGLEALKEGWEVMERTGQHWWEAEVHRLQGALLWRQAPSDVAEAESCFHQALDVARRQQAKSLELRAAMSLARLWQIQGKRNEARALLSPVYEWFTEGFDTADLIEAKALLDELGG